MSRPLRIEFPGAIYHVTSRGDRRESIFEDDDDRRALLGVVAHGLERFDEAQRGPRPRVTRPEARGPRPEAPTRPRVRSCIPTFPRLTSSKTAAKIEEN